MADALRDLLVPDSQVDAAALNYLSYLAEQSCDALQSSEPQHLAQASHSLLLSVQALSKRSHKPVVESAASHATLRQTLPVLAQRASDLSQAVPRLGTQAEHFSTAFGKASESKVLARRKQALLLLRNSERLVDMMEMPPLLNSAIATAPVNYSSSLELYTHVRRLASLYPNSPLASSVLAESDAAIHQMAADLIASLKAPNLKLAAAVRTVGWLKRIVPDLVSGVPTEDALPAVFLVCRLATLVTTLEALEPLRALADDERLRRDKATNTWSGGQQTERYLKRFIEIFREHSFGIISVFKNVSASFAPPSGAGNDPLRPSPSAMSSFPLHLVEMLLETLRIYLPVVKDQGSRESILTQVLYCAGSLGRLGADFGMLLAQIGVTEWADLVRRHRLLAGRLESVIGGSHMFQPRILVATLTQDLDIITMGIMAAGQPVREDDLTRPISIDSARSSPSAKAGCHFVSGLGSGVASAVILQPLDLLKTRVQQSGGSSLSACLKDLKQSPNVVGALWRGTIPSALRTGFGSALYFTTLNSIRQYASQTGALGQRLPTQGRSSVLPSLTNSANLVSGAVARTFAGFVLMPLTVIKVRFESTFYSYPSVLAAAQDIRRTHGLRGFFSGFGATALRDAPYAGMYVLFYEMLKSHLGVLASPTKSSSHQPTRLEAALASSVNFSSAMLAGAACSVVSNPFDAVKTRIQLRPEEYRNIWHAWYKMVTQDGVRSLWDGLALRMSRKAISSALAWTVYEELIRRAGTK